MAPLVVKNHVITGVSGDDLDRPGYPSNRTTPRPATCSGAGTTVPQKKGDPG